MRVKGVVDVEWIVRFGVAVPEGTSVAPTDATFVRTKFRSTVEPVTTSESVPPLPTKVIFVIVEAFALCRV